MGGSVVALRGEEASGIELLDAEDSLTGEFSLLDAA